ncbi:MAG: hypothetical protein HY284_03075 [Nitrospirae bacterium]|nr:hypothetical protein [Nitrospirota bacterium]
MSRIVRWFADRRRCSERDQQALAVFASHDMRSPMATVREAAALLADGGAGEVNERQKRLLAIILDRTETWLRLVDGALVLPQWAAEGCALHLQEVNLQEVARESVGKVRGLLLVREVAVDLVISEALPNVMADRHRIVQALTILLAAVIASTPQGGRARLSVTLESDTAVQVEMSAMHATGKTDEPPGLMSARAVVEAHGGRFRARMTGAATTYAFTLPLRVSEECAHE